MRKKLLFKLHQVQEEVIRNKDLGVQKLERLSSETRKAFDSAIESILFKRNILKELEEKRSQLKLWRIGILKTWFPINFKYLFSMPFIYGMLLPVFLLQIALEIYHQVCFRLYGIPLVDRKEYFIYDRQLLPHLNWWEKINCIYCSYVNNCFRYWAEIGGRTERFWCPIKYARRINNAHSQYSKFVDYLDAENFHDKWDKLRDFSDINNNEKSQTFVDGQK